MAIIVQDSFTRADNTTSLGVADTGQTWVDVLTGFGIISNQAYTATQADRLAVVDSGIYNGKAQIKHVGYHEYSKLVWRFTDVNNLYWIEANLVRKKVSGVQTTIATLTQTPIYGSVVKIEFNGNIHTIYIDGVQVGTFTDSFNQTATKHGMGIYNTGARLDDFLIESLTSGTPYTKSLSDTVSTSETFTKLFNGFKSLSDTIFTSESSSKQFTAIVIDSITTSESENEISSKALNDSIVGTDSLSYTQGKAISLSDSVTISEAISKALMKLKTDSVGTSDIENKTQSKQLSDILTQSDTIVAIGGKAINLSDTIMIVDSISKSLSKLKIDSINTSEVDQESITKSLLDSIGQTDNITYNKGKAIMLNDSLFTVDALSKTIGKFRSDITSLSDSFGKQTNVSVRLYDIIVSTDTLTVFLPNAPQLIGKIQLKGERVLNVYLVANRELYINLKGGINMTAENQDFSIIQGDTKFVCFKILDATLNLSGCTVKWGLKKRKVSTTYEVFKTTTNGITIVNGDIQIKLNPADTANLTGRYYHEAEIVDQLGNISTVMRGTVLVTEGIVK